MFGGREDFYPSPGIGVPDVPKRVVTGCFPGSIGHCNCITQDLDACWQEKRIMVEDEPEDSKHDIGSRGGHNRVLGSESTDLLRAVSERTRLAEGEEAVRRILREVYRHGRIRTRDLAYATRLPLPVVAAVRRELEKAGLLARRGGATLTEKGKAYVAKVLGVSMSETLVCSTCSGKKISISEAYDGVLKKLEEYSKLRPRPYTWLDQAFATPQTSVLRALFMLEEGDVEGRNIVFLGDDDLTSVATGLLRAARKISVIDVDKRLLDLIQDISEREELGIECILHDLRSALPVELRSRYDVVFTDPPYTIQGLRLFVSRGIEALSKVKCRSIYLAFAHKPPKEMLRLQMAINEMGLVMRELIPRFNRYEGAEMFANTTFLARLETTGETCPSITGSFEGKIYTGEVSPTMRIYKCKCGEEIQVGAGRDFRTIEELKSKGCPTCGRRKGFRLLKKIRLVGE